MIAENYDTHAHIQRDLLAWGWPQLEPWARRCKHVLEVGAGTGMMTRHWVTVAEKVIASDHASTMCVCGKRNVPEASWKKLDAWKLREESSYDCIASSSFLHWAQSPVAVLEQWRQALRPRGFVMALLFGKGTAQEYYSLLGESPVVWRSKHDWEHVLVESRFKPLLIKDVSYPYIFPSTNTFLRFLRETGTLGSSSTTRVSTLMKLNKAYTRQHTVSSGGVLSTWNFILIVARRD